MKSKLVIILLVVLSLIAPNIYSAQSIEVCQDFYVRLPENMGIVVMNNSIVFGEGFLTTSITFYPYDGYLGKGNPTSKKVLAEIQSKLLEPKPIKFKFNSGVNRSGYEYKTSTGASALVIPIRKNHKTYIMFCESIDDFSLSIAKDSLIKHFTFSLDRVSSSLE